MKLSQLAGRRTVVWGAGEEGRAAACAALRAGASEVVAVTDEPPDPAALATWDRAGLSGVPVTSGAAARAARRRAEVLVLSPSVSRYRPEILEAQRRGAHVTNGTALFLSDHAGRTIAVTGSKGKSTVTRLTAHLLGAVGRDAVAAGNVGAALLDLPVGGDRRVRASGSEPVGGDRRVRASGSEPVGGDRRVRASVSEPVGGDRRVRASASEPVGGDPLVVAEISSYQAALVTTAPHIAVLTSLFPDHLPWHGSIEQYYRDKLRLFAGGGSQRGLANGADSGVRSMRTTGELDNAELYAAADSVVRIERARLVVHDVPVIPLARCRLVGDHNAANVAGAVAALVAVGVDVAAEAGRLEEALAAFSPLPHRLEVIASVQGLTFVDDSLATTPQAAIAACEAFRDRPLALLVGGTDRGVDYAPLVTYLESRAATSPLVVLAMGPAGRRVAALLVAVEALLCDDVTEAVRVGAEALLPAGHDGVVLLSPAAASPAGYGSYRNRSQAFRTGVERLQQLPA